MTLSPSFSSLIDSVKKHALRSYDAVSQQSNALLKKSGVNSLVNEMKKFNKSYNKDSSIISDVSANEESLLNGTINYQDHLDASDPAFQLDTGSSGDLLPLSFWMHDFIENFDEKDSLLGMAKLQIVLFMII